MNKLRSDAAVARANKHRRLAAEVTGEPGNRVIELYDPTEPHGSPDLAHISLKDFISKRKSLRGVNARLKAAIRPKKAAKKKRK